MFNLRKQRSLRNLKKIIPAMFLGICCSTFAGNELIPQLMQQGMKNYTEKKYAAAADYLGQVVDMDPEHSQARYYLVYSLALSGHREQALKHAEILSRKFPKDSQYKNLIKQIKAEEDKQTAEITPKDLGFGKIQKEVMLGGYKSMDKNFEMRKPKEDYTPRDITPPKPLTELEKAVLKIDDGDLDTAYSMLKELQKKEPKNAEVLYNLGIVEKSRNKFSQAIDYFKKATSIDSKNFESYFHMADCYRSLNDYQHAGEAFKKATDLKYDEFALMNLAEAYIETGKYKAAEEIYKKILQKNPKFADASVGLAQIKLEQGKLTEAMNMVNEALIAGGSSEANYVKAKILMADRMYAEAIEELVGPIAANPTNQKYILARALSYIRAYDFTRGVDDASSVLAINPNSVPAMVIIAEAFILTSADNEATAQLEKIESLAKNIPDLHRLRGMMYKNQGNEEEAKNEYKKYYEMAGSVPAAAYDFAEFLETLDGNQEEAITYYNQIKKQFPDTIYSTRADEAISRLNSNNGYGESPDAAFDAGPSNNYRTGNMKF